MCMNGEQRVEINKIYDQLKHDISVFTSDYMLVMQGHGSFPHSLSLHTPDARSVNYMY